ncbi:MAG: C40 family peptidase [Bacteroidales bacterium]|nr:C40 family peptidase [Bacteroidales bacterium]
MQAKSLHIILLLILVCLGAQTVVAAPPARDSVTLSASQVADLIIDEAYKHIGTPYRYGARGPKAFDCSGFTSYVYRQFGINLSRSSRDQARDGKAVEGTYADMQKGDIIIFGARASRRSIGHVGIFIEMMPDGQDFTFIHAATHGGVTVSHIKEEYYSARFLGARRILPDFDIELSEPEPEPIDFEAVYGNVFLPIKDTLSLGEADRRIVLFGDGSWAAVAEDGSLSGDASGLGTRIILNPGGTWQVLAASTSSMRIPSLAAGNAASTTSPSSSTSGSSSTTAVSSGARPSSASSQTVAAAAGESADAQYHVIKNGDTHDKISKIYHTTIDRLCELNGITRKTILHIGRRLRVR